MAQNVVERIGLWFQVLEGLHPPIFSKKRTKERLLHKFPLFAQPSSLSLLSLSLALDLTIVDEVVGTALEGGACNSGRDTGSSGKQGSDQVHILVHDCDV